MSPHPPIVPPLSLTRHARRRMRHRALAPAAIDAALAYGRIVRVRGAEIFALGRREVEAAAREGVDLSHHEGVHVVCNASGVVLTVYRNRCLRGLRPRAPRRHRPRWH